jgi:hypothetical protein
MTTPGTLRILSILKSMNNSRTRTLRFPSDRWISISGAREDVEGVSRLDGTETRLA